MPARPVPEKVVLLALSVLFAVVLTCGEPENTFLLSFFIVPILLASGYYCLAGGLGCAAASAVLAVVLAVRSGVPMDDGTIAAQVILYFLVGGFGGVVQRENSRIRKELEIGSWKDELTGLYDYTRFRQLLKEEVARAKRCGRPVSLIMSDVDHFKGYNDTFGHANGNFILNKIGTLIQESIRESDIAFRYGGDEFSIILPETGREAGQVAERVVSVVDAAFYSQKADPSVRPALTVGVAFSMPDAPLTDSELIFKADSALYEAKRPSVMVSSSLSRAPVLRGDPCGRDRFAYQH